MQYTKEATRFDKQPFYTGLRVRPYRCNCVICGDEFRSKSPFSMYCSRRCANDAAIAKRKARIIERKALAAKCAVCGKPIGQDNWTKVRSYCSAACKQRAYRARRALASGHDAK